VNAGAPPPGVPRRPRAASPGSAACLMSPGAWPRGRSTHTGTRSACRTCCRAM